MGSTTSAEVHDVTDGVEPYQMSVKRSALYLKSQLNLLPGVVPGKIPRIMKETITMASGLVLPERSARHYP